MLLHLVNTIVALFSTAVAVELRVADNGGRPVSPMQYGIFFEDINHSGDGGLYGELIQNRAFQANSTDNAATWPWAGLGDASIAVDTTFPLSPALPYSVVVTPPVTGGVVGISNPGFWGMNVVPQVYTGSFYVRGGYNGDMTVSLQSNLTTDVFASEAIPVTSTDPTTWVRIDFTLNPPAPAPNSNNTFAISYDSESAAGPLSFNLISLFPPTFNDRPNGMRIDLMEILADLEPSFLRFPGGNNLEGDQGSGNHWVWSETIGPLKDRPGRDGVWGYYNTDGIGLDEYFNWAEDLDLEPVLAIWDGYYLLGPALSPEELAPYVQDALNELEYILGDNSTAFGAMRAANGYPEPRKLNYVEIGNEDNLGTGTGQDTYTAYRFNMFYTAITNVYPDINVIASSSNGPLPLPDSVIGSYHIYSRPDLLVQSFDIFNGNSSINPTFADEVAVWRTNTYNETFNETSDFADEQVPWPFWIGSVAEAIFFIGLEANSEATIGTTYAPLFQNLNSYAWAPDLISFTADPAQSLRSTSYQVFQLLSTTRMSQTRPITSDGLYGPAYWVAGQNTDTGAHILKAAVYNSTVDVLFNVTFDGVAEGESAILTILTAPDPYDSVLPAQPDPVVYTITNMTAGSGGSFDFSLPALSVALLATEGSNGFGGAYSFGGYGGCKNGATRQSYNWTSWVASGTEGSGC